MRLTSAAAVTLLAASLSAGSARPSTNGSGPPGFITPAHVLSGHKKGVDSVAFSPDGHYLASGSWDNTVRLWDLSTGETVKTLHAPGNLHLTFRTSLGIFAVAFSANGQYLASGGWNNVVGLWRLPRGDRVRTIRGRQWDWVVPAKPGFVDCVAFSPDSRYLAIGGGDKKIRISSLASGASVRELRGHSRLVRSIAFSPDGRYLVSGSWDETIRVWDFPAGNLLRALKGHLGTVESVAFSRDGRYLASASGNDVRLWDAATWQQIWKMTGHTQRARAVAFSPDGHYLVSVSDDGTVRFWGVPGGYALGRLEPHDGALTSVAFRPDGRVLVAGSFNGTVLVWERTD